LKKLEGEINLPTSTNLLSPNDLIELTGSKNPGKQIEVLARHGIKFVTRTDGKIRTTWQAVDTVLSQKAKAVDQEPNLDFLRQ
jgi:Domain of unknown function (DUF4224)